jgi:ubiquinone/menaquinone biosynthesis C-methylase UbiE
VEAESEQERSKRRYQRTLFERVAESYEACRLGYPSEVVEFVTTTAELGSGSKVLEVGCGTGQLTESLARYGFDLTAIDIGPTLVAMARRRLDGSAVSFQTSSFEELDVAEGCLDLIVSGTAFHWVDPEVKYSKSIRLLRPGGWLALLATEERYDDLFGKTLLDMWIARSDDRGAWLNAPSHSDVANIAATGLFETPVQMKQTERMILPVDAVVGLENTRATSLSWPDDVRLSFSDELRRHLQCHTQLSLTRHTSVTMARSASR